MRRHVFTPLVIAFGLSVTLLALASPTATADGPANGSSRTAAVTPDPLAWNVDIGDPSVTTYADGAKTRYVAIGTGAELPRLGSVGANRQWHSLPAAPALNPAWVLPGAQWAPDLFETPYGWVLYTSARIDGLASDARCIAVLTGESPGGEFYPVSKAPLVCPPRAGGVPAEDQLADRSVDLPASGVIDPSVFQRRDGRLFLLYKTQGKPATIRLLPLTADGKHPAGPSVEILRTSHTVENPVLVQREDRYVLFTSEGEFTNCGYQTTYRRSRDLTHFPSSSTPLLDRGNSGVCGPGGGDIVVKEKRDVEETQLFFHGWVCNNSNRACPVDFARRRDAHLQPKRALYGVELAWGRSGRPSVVDSLAN